MRDRHAIGVAGDASADVARGAPRRRNVADGGVTIDALIADLTI